ncbi:MAG: trans-splicing intein-formed DNA polymerase III subunit alpha C-terminal partner DnaE-C [Richelia sp. RM2_1_2]|nr:trans-splicing intein-formed DNA polymerase III subunit alpha C-terminal partner DnaE-C [Richelia sp. RM1_1_1]NJO26217.1 trans-splicing intein-formed DNA polymerase III subunit alpha C-terminal partner DnaE-C [Richelia sp. SL_2_1]NJO58085.1 trans-splicing intein-formed DNA polymerase III subunit alpha C-terminal partner DnaE-C [Richelia sp. RM2_1_2]
MVKIVSRKALNTQIVYDIGLERDHNFAIKNGLIASNCFNKSHSTAYGYVTYQTAYLKANYPLEYMTALLTANSGDKDKIQKYIATCMNMGIQIESPDINSSEVDFTPADGKILFGLSAIRNVGENAINYILQAREAGVFKSLADFCDRVDLGTVNRRTLQSLINCGAFDKINSNRNQLTQDLELIYDWAQSRARDRASGQGNLFDLFGGAWSGDSAAKNPPMNAVLSPPKAKEVPDLPPHEKLRMEKELLGFYVSDHPLKSIRKSTRILSPINMTQLKSQGEEAKVCVVVILNNVKKVVTKKGDPMAILQIEDLTTTGEAVVFPKTYERINQILQVDRKLIIWGKVDKKDDQAQLLVDDAEPVENVELVIVEMTPQQAATIEEHHRLRTILKDLQDQSNEKEKEKGKVPVIGIIQGENSRQMVRFGRQYWVQDSTTAIMALHNGRFFARIQPLMVRS